MITSCRPSANGRSISLTDLSVTMIIGIWLRAVSKVMRKSMIKNGVMVLHWAGQAPE